jgi:hypothetical protein
MQIYSFNGIQWPRWATTVLNGSNDAIVGFDIYLLRFLLMYIYKPLNMRLYVRFSESNLLFNQATTYKTGESSRMRGSVT